MRKGVGRERAANPNSPARLSPALTHTSFHLPLEHLDPGQQRPRSWVCLAAAISWTQDPRPRRTRSGEAPIPVWLCGHGPAGLHLLWGTGGQRLRSDPGSHCPVSQPSSPDLGVAPKVPAASSRACSGQSRTARAWAGCPFPAGPLPGPASGLGHLFLVVTKPLLNMQDCRGQAVP